MSIADSNACDTRAADTASWQTRPAVHGSAADWLLSERLLTPDILRSFTAPMQIDVLREQTLALPDCVRAVIGAPSADGWLREIHMASGDTLLVHALCFAPLTTIEQHPWLRQLDDRPLGASLAKLERIYRSEMRFCESHLVDGALASDVGRWTRRSIFSLQEAPLVLFEHMTEALLSQPRRVTRA